MVYFKVFFISAYILVANIFFLFLYNPGDFYFLFITLVVYLKKVETIIKVITERMGTKRFFLIYTCTEKKHESQTRVHVHIRAVSHQKKFFTNTPFLN